MESTAPNLSSLQQPPAKKRLRKPRVAVAVAAVAAAVPDPPFIDPGGPMVVVDDEAATIIEPPPAKKPRQRKKATTASVSAVSRIAVPETNYDDYLVYLSTGRAHMLRHFFESLKNVLQETSLIFTPTHIKVTATNSTESVIIYSRLEGKHFESYHVSEKTSVGVQLQSLFKVIRQASERDLLTLLVERSNPDRLIISIKNSVSTVFSFPLLDLPSDEITLPTFTYPVQIMVPSLSFQRVMRDLDSLGTQYVELKSVGNNLIVSSLNTDVADSHISVSQETVFEGRRIVPQVLEDPVEEGGTGPDAHVVVSSEAGEVGIQSGVFLLKYLVFFSKHQSSLSDDVSVYLRNDFALLLSYDISSFGKLCYIVLPSNPNQSKKS